MTEGETRPIPDDSETAEPKRWFKDWRVWLGAAITFVCLWYAMRGIPLADVRAAMAVADLPVLIAISVPAYVLSIFSRSLRWRHLTNPIAPISRGMLFRAASIGFMVNNLVPLRIGELVRSWYLARESGTSATAILGTVILERVLDVVCVLLMAVGALALLGNDSGENGMLAQGAQWLLPAAAVPLLGLIVLRMAPRQMMTLVKFVSRPMPARVGELLEYALGRFTDGLGALSGGSHLVWIVFHSLVLWLVCQTLPFLAALYAFDLDLGPPIQMVFSTWILLAAVGVAVAIPSAPGFVGPYQVAFSMVLTRFGVEPATALAIGLLVWFIFWVTVTLQGLVVLRLSGMSLRELTQVSSKDPHQARR